MKLWLALAACTLLHCLGAASASRAVSAAGLRGALTKRKLTEHLHQAIGYPTQHENALLKSIATQGNRFARSIKSNVDCAVAVPSPLPTECPAPHVDKQSSISSNVINKAQQDQSTSMFLDMPANFRAYLQRIINFTSPPIIASDEVRMQVTYGAIKNLLNAYKSTSDMSSLIDVPLTCRVLELYTTGDVLLSHLRDGSQFIDHLDMMYELNSIQVLEVIIDKLSQAKVKQWHNFELHNVDMYRALSRIKLLPNWHSRYFFDPNWSGRYVPERTADQMLTLIQKLEPFGGFNANLLLHAYKEGWDWLSWIERRMDREELDKVQAFPWESPCLDDYGLPVDSLCQADTYEAIKTQCKVEADVKKFMEHNTLNVHTFNPVEVLQSIATLNQPHKLPSNLIRAILNLRIYNKTLLVPAAIEMTKKMPMTLGVKAIQNAIAALGRDDPWDSSSAESETVEIQSSLKRKNTKRKFSVSDNPEKFHQ